MGLKIVIPIEYQRVNKISLRAMPYFLLSSPAGEKRGMLEGKKT